jgi:hypothetical protein
MSEEQPVIPATHEIEKIIARQVLGRHASLDEREKLLQHLDVSRQEIEDLFATVAVEREIYPGWTKKEIISHLTGWEDGSLQSVRAMLAGAPPSVPVALRGPDYYNEQSVIERADLTYDQVIREWRLARQEFSNLVRAMSPEQFTTKLVFPWGLDGTVTDALLGLLSHEQEHIRQIRALLE